MYYQVKTRLKKEWFIINYRVEWFEEEEGLFEFVIYLDDDLIFIDFKRTKPRVKYFGVYGAC